MPKRLFVAVLTDKQQKRAAIIAKSFSEQDVYIDDENTFVIAHDCLTRDVARQAGIFKD